MAPLKVHKPSAILFDIIGTATKSYFIDQILFPYIRQNAKVYLENNWDNSVLQNDIKLLREQCKKEKSSVKIPDANGDPLVIQSAVVEYVKSSLDQLKDNEALTQFKFHMLFDGYAKNRIETPLYTDVAIAIRHWAIDDNIQLFVFSNGWCEATKRYLQKTNHGDMNLLITGHFDTQMGPLTEPSTYKRLLKEVKHQAEDILFLTHSGAEGHAAKKAGLSVVLIMTHRRDITKLSPEEKTEMPYVRSFNELVFTGNAPKAYQLDGSSSAADDDEGTPGSKAKSGSTTSLSKGSGSSAASSKQKSSTVASKSDTAASSAASNKPKSSSAASSAASSKSKATSAVSSAASSKPKSSSAASSSAASSSKSSEAMKSKKASSDPGGPATASNEFSNNSSMAKSSKKSSSGVGSKASAAGKSKSQSSTAASISKAISSSVSQQGSKASSSKASATGSKASKSSSNTGSKSNAGTNSKKSSSKASASSSASGSAN